MQNYYFAIKTLMKSTDYYEVSSKPVVNVMMLFVTQLYKLCDVTFTAFLITTCGLTQHID
jgi:hypothetical protein